MSITALIARATTKKSNRRPRATAQRGGRSSGGERAGRRFRREGLPRGRSSCALNRSRRQFRLDRTRRARCRAGTRRASARPPAGRWRRSTPCRRGIAQPSPRSCRSGRRGIRGGRRRTRPGRDAWPIVNGSAPDALERLESDTIRPATIISGPNRLSGRRCQAIRPARTYVRMIQSSRPAWSPGSSPGNSLERRSAIAHAAPAMPKAAITITTHRLGERGRPGRTNSPLRSRLYSRRRGRGKLPGPALVDRYAGTVCLSHSS